MQQFDSEIEIGRTKLSSEINGRLGLYISKIKEKIDHNFENLDQHLINEKAAIIDLTTRSNDLDLRFNTLEGEIKKYSGLDKLE